MLKANTMFKNNTNMFRVNDCTIQVTLLRPTNKWTSLCRR